MNALRKAIFAATCVGSLVAMEAPALAQTTLRAVMHSDLKILDPIWTTAYIVRNHGYMIYDTLLAQDEKGEIKPQMVEKYEALADGKSYTFTLRDGLSGMMASRSRRKTASPRSSAGPRRTPSARR